MRTVKGRSDHVVVLGAGLADLSTTMHRLFGVAWHAAFAVGSMADRTLT